MTINYLIKCSFALLICLCSQQAYANMLYRAKVDVPNRSAEARKVAFSIGMWEVLNRVTGDASIFEIAEVDSMRISAEQYLQSYGYTENVDVLTVEMLFNAKQINSKLQALDIHPWVKRPSILMWLLVDGKTLNQMDPNLFALLTARLSAESDKHGLEVAQPLYDIEEIHYLDNSTSTNTQASIEELSKRYAKEVIVAGNFTKENDEWKVVITMYSQSETQHWSIKSDSPESLIGMIVKDVANLLRDSFNTQDLYNFTKVTFNVRNVSSSKEYKRVQDYLQGISIVNSATIASMSKNEISFNLELTQEVAKLRDVLELNEQFVEIHNSDPSYLIYKFVP